MDIYDVHFIGMEIIVILSSFNCIAFSELTVLSTKIIQDTWDNNHYLTLMVHS